jgi:hypothetical protein
LINALCFKFLIEFFVAREMSGRSRWCEGSWEGKKHYSFPSKNFLGGAILPTIGIWSGDKLITDASLENYIRDASNYSHNISYLFRLTFSHYKEWKSNTAVPAVMKHGRDTAMPCPYED